MTTILAALVTLSGAVADDKPAFDIRDGDGTVLIVADEVTAYDWKTHTLTLKPGTADRLRKGFHEKKRLTVPFAVAVGGKAVYTGELTTVLSSNSCRGVVIVVDEPLTLAKEKDGDRIRLQLGYPGEKFYEGKDPRGDDRVRDALTAAGKLR